MIVVPDQGQVDLGRSRIQPRDTYVGAPIDRRGGGGGGLDDLAKALSGLSGIAADYNKTKEQEDMRRIEYYANHVQTIRKDMADGGPWQAQIGNILPDQSPTVRARVMEKVGADDGRAWVDAQYRTLFSDPAANFDPAETERRLQQIRAEAREKVKDHPDWGNGFVSAVEAQLNQFAQQKSAERNGFYQQKQAEGYTEAQINKAEGAKAGTMVQWRTADTQIDKYKNLSSLLPQGKSFEHVGKLKADFADRLETMVSEAPPEVRKSLQMVSGFRSTERQAEIFQDAVSKYGSEAAARKWAAPPGKSNHNHGEAVDLKYLSEDAKKWVHDNAERYGLYFPMKHEPWHIEMRGGRREGAPNHRHDVAPSDGEDITPDARAAYLRKMYGTESGNNPSAQNGRSTAGGLAQFIDSTWLAEARSLDPSLKAKSDAEVIRMKTDSTPAGIAFQKKVAEHFTDKNIDRLTKAGLPVTEANLYLMHFAGEGDGPKIIKARGGTRIEDVMSTKAVQDNGLSGMSVSEVREWAAEKMGNATNGISRARNSIRATDREWGYSSSLSNQYRAELVSKSLQQRAIQTMDPSYLDMIPPEFVTPAMRAEIGATRRQVMELQDREYQRQRMRKKQAEEDEANTLIDDINAKLAKGEDIDPRAYAGNKVAFAYARQQEGINLQVSEVDSKANSTILRNEILSYGTTTDAKLLETYPELKAKAESGEPLSLRDFLTAVRNDPRLRSAEKNALLAEMPRLMEGSAVLRDPVITEAYLSRVFNITKLVEADPTFAALSQQFKLDLSGEVKKVYQNSVKRQILGHYSQFGQKPNESQLDVMIEKAVTESLALHKSMVDTIKANPMTGIKTVTDQMSGGAKPATPAPAATPQAPAPAQPQDQSKANPELERMKAAAPKGWTVILNAAGKPELVKDTGKAKDIPGSDPVDLTFTADPKDIRPREGVSIKVGPEVIDSVTRALTGRD